ncbi:MAG TPA: hypothetical protein VN776_13080 [Terracidiphilus sp.]|nr:hypothetical protein [Terracidiphilus sp.]
MLKFTSASPAHLLAGLLATSFVSAGAPAQNPPAGSSASAPPAANANPSSPAPARPDVNAAFLAKASQLYYSTAKAGLKAFDCAVHPDWRTAVLSAAPGTTVADDDPDILLLKTVKITLHGRLAGGSTLDWNPAAIPAKPLDRQSTDLLDHMHSAADRTLTGFMQFWSPFVDGSVIPATPDGLQITHDAKGHTIHADQEGTSLTEILDNDLVMQQFNVVMGGAKINFSPRYKPTGQSLLVNAFQARIQGPSDPPEQAEQMHVEVDYQTIAGFPIPSRISMEVVGQSKFDATLDGCTVNPE